jgi:peptide chain release factor 1
MLEYSLDFLSISEVISEARGYIGFEKEKKELEKIINEKNSEKEMIKLAENELIQLLRKKKEYEKKLKIFLLPKDEADSKNAILEIRAGTGRRVRGYLVCC